MAASQTKKPAGYRLVKTCSLFFWPSTDTRDKRRQSHLLVKQAWVRFVAKQENLQGTGILHALVHIFAPRSGAQAMSENSILWYRRYK